MGMRGPRRVPPAAGRPPRTKGVSVARGQEKWGSEGGATSERGCRSPDGCGRGTPHRGKGPRREHRDPAAGTESIGTPQPGQRAQGLRSRAGGTGTPHRPRTCRLRDVPGRSVRARLRGLRGPRFPRGSRARFPGSGSGGGPAGPWGPGRSCALRHPRGQNRARRERDRPGTRLHGAGSWPETRF